MSTERELQMEREIAGLKQAVAALTERVKEYEDDYDDEEESEQIIRGPALQRRRAKTRPLTLIIIAAAIMIIGGLGLKFLQFGKRDKPEAVSKMEQPASAGRLRALPQREPPKRPKEPPPEQQAQRPEAKKQKEGYWATVSGALAMMNDGANGLAFDGQGTPRHTFSQAEIDRVTGDKDLAYYQAALKSSDRILGAQPLGDLTKMALTGTYIPVTLMPYVNSELPSPLSGIVSSHVYTESGFNVCIPAGSKVHMTANHKTDILQHRLFSVASTINVTDPNYQPRKLRIDSLAVGRLGAGGIPAIPDYHFSERSFFAVMNVLLGLGVNEISNEVLQDSAAAVASEFGNASNRLANQPATLNVPQGSEIHVYLMGDLNCFLPE